MNEITQLPTIPAREPDGHKGDYGKILVVAGSMGMTGAAVLCGRGALRGGAGLVRIATPEKILPIVAAGHPCYTTLPMPCDNRGFMTASALADLLDAASANDVLAIGPGLGQSDDLKTLLAELLPQIDMPLVLDADALNNLSNQSHVWRQCKAPIVITPHPGEFARLAGESISTIQSDRAAWAARFASEHKLVVLLKGQGTLVTDGDRVFRNTTGNPGMASGGCGDVLTGLIAAMIGQGFKPFDAAQLSAHLHGKAGDLARDVVGETCLIATDLLDYLPTAIEGRGARGEGRA